MMRPARERAQFGPDPEPQLVTGRFWYIPGGELQLALWKARRALRCCSTRARSDIGPGHEPEVLDERLTEHAALPKR